MNSTSLFWIESRLWPWLGDFAWQATALLTITLLSLFFLRHRSASARHKILALGTMGVACLAILPAVMPAWSIKSTVTKERPLTRPNDAAARVALSKDQTPAMPVPPSARKAALSVPSSLTSSSHSSFSSPSNSASMPVWIAAIWIAGMLAGGVMLAASMWRLRRLQQRAERATDPKVQSALHRACADAGLHTESVRLLVAPRGTMPAMWGWRRVIILLPGEATEWTRSRLDFVLRHELAHAARGDAPLSLACWFALLPLWWHPLAWVALRMLSRLREEACDEQVVAGLNPARHADYAETLVHVIAAANPVSRRTWLPALAMASSHARSLRARLEAIVDEHRDRSPLSRRGRACALGTITILAVGLSMLSACKEPSKPATGVTSADGSRTYFLTDKQWESLTTLSDSERRAPSPPTDPFAPTPPPQSDKEPPLTRQESLSKLALRIRTHLLESGVTFMEAPEGDVLVLKDERTMRIWADNANHERIAKLLTGAERKPLVRIVCHAFAVPLDATWLEPLTNLRLGNVAKSQATPALTAMLSAEEADTLIRRIQSDKSCSLFAAPTVATMSGQRATIENIREFIYPTEFDPPEVSQATSPPPAGSRENVSAFPVTPTTPTAFEMRPVGFRFEVDPVVDIHSRTIDVSLAPEWTVFEGFVNYGAPIYTSATDAVGKVVPVELTSNKIQQPIFRTAKLTTSMTIHDGQSVVLGGFGEPPGADIGDPKNGAGLPRPGEGNTIRAETGRVESVAPTGSYGTQGGVGGELNLQKLPPISKVDRAVFFIFQLKIVDAQETK